MQRALDKAMEEEIESTPLLSRISTTYSIGRTLNNGNSDTSTPHTAAAYYDFFFQNDPRHNPLISKCPHPLVEGGTLMSIKSFHNASQAFQYALTHSIFPQRIHNALNAFYRSSLPSPTRSSHLQSPPFLFNAQCTFHHILPHIDILTIPYHM